MDVHGFVLQRDLSCNMYVLHYLHMHIFIIIILFYANNLDCLSLYT